MPIPVTATSAVITPYILPVLPAAKDSLAPALELNPDVKRKEQLFRTHSLADSNLLAFEEIGDEEDEKFTDPFETEGLFDISAETQLLACAGAGPSSSSGAYTPAQQALRNWNNHSAAIPNSNSIGSFSNHSSSNGSAGGSNKRVEIQNATRQRTTTNRSVVSNINSLS